MALYTTDPPGQDGYGISGSWEDETGAVLPVGTAPFAVALSGLVFDCAGLPIESGEVRLALATGSETPALETVQISWVPEAAPANYSLAAAPGARAELLISEALYTGGPPGTVVTLVLGQTHDATHQSQVDAALAQLRATTALASWSGRVAFTAGSPGASAMLFESAEGAGTAPTLEVVETQPQEIASLAHVAKLLRATLIKRLNLAPGLVALNLAFEDMVGRAIEDVDRNARRGFVGTHPEAADPDVPDVRTLDVIVVVVVGARHAAEAADQLDDAQEAIEHAIRVEPTVGGLVPGHLAFARAEPALNGEGRRDYGSRVLTYRAVYATRED